MSLFSLCLSGSSTSSMLRVASACARQGVAVSSRFLLHSQTRALPAGVLAMRTMATERTPRSRTRPNASSTDAEPRPAAAAAPVAPPSGLGDMTPAETDAWLSELECVQQEDRESNAMETSDVERERERENRRQRETARRLLARDIPR